MILKQKKWLGGGIGVSISVIGGGGSGGRGERIFKHIFNENTDILG